MVMPSWFEERVAAVALTQQPVYAVPITRTNCSVCNMHLVNGLCLFADYSKETVDKAYALDQQGENVGWARAIIAHVEDDRLAYEEDIAAEHYDAYCAAL